MGLSLIYIIVSSLTLASTGVQDSADTSLRYCNCALKSHWARLAARAKRESASLKRYVDKILLEMSFQKIKKQKLIVNFIIVNFVTDVEKIGKRTVRRVATIRY